MNVSFPTSYTKITRLLALLMIENFKRREQNIQKKYITESH